MADYYGVLGVDRKATADEIKKAYRKRARDLHPDANPDNPEAAEQFKELSTAYAVLSNDEQRARYDRFGEAGVGGPGGANFEDLFGGAGLGDIFDAFFGGGSNPFGGRRGPTGPPRGQDMEVAVTVDFESSVFGAQIPVELKLPQRCEECDGSGAGEGTKPVTCAECDGSGQVRRVRQSVLGQMVSSSPCPPMAPKKSTRLPCRPSPFGLHARPIRVCSCSPTSKPCSGCRAHSPRRWSGSARSAPSCWVT